MTKLRANMAIELGVNFLLPWLAYRLALPHWGMLGALYASAAPPIVWSVIEFARSRRVDALSVLVVVGIALSVGLMALGGSPRLLLVRESLISGAIGAAFLLSLLWPRPLIFYLARATVARREDGAAARFEIAWDERPALRRLVRLMTLVWGIGLVGENLLRCWMAWTWPIERFLLVSPVVSYGIYGALTVWTFWYRKRFEARMR
ncbi:MAG: VC0807 family protein [Janthinobacterium lividum]